MVEFPLCMFILETLSFVVGWHITIWPFILAFFGLLGYETWCIQDKTARVKYPVVVTSMVALCVFLMTFFYDTSFDGQWYHSAVILLQQQGWNPFYDPIITAETEPFGGDTHIWISHYAKGMETIESGIVVLTGNLESGKSLNIMLVLAMGGYVYCFLNHILPLRKKWLHIVITLLFVLNPVVINQMFTHYIDFACYVFVVIGCILLYDIIILKNQRSMMTLLLTCFFVPTIKMNIVFWVIIDMLLFMFIICVRNRQFYRGWQKMAVAVLLGFLVGGFNPYVTNIYLKGNVLYPLDGSAREVVEKNSMPDMMWGKNRFYQANYSLVVNPYNHDAQRHGETNVFSISKEDVMDSAVYDVRLGGFGIFFFEAILFLLILFFSLPKSSNWKFVGGGICFLYMSLFILPSGSSARYVPFFYLLPLLIIVLALSEEYMKKYQSIILSISATLISLNAIISFTGVSAMVVQQKMQCDYIVKELKGYGQKVYVRSKSCQLYSKLEKANIDFTIEKPEGKLLYKIDMVGCDPIIDAPISIFQVDEQPMLMKKIPMFQLKVSEYKESKAIE